MKRLLVRFLTTSLLCLAAAPGYGQTPAGGTPQRRTPRYKVMHMKNGHALIPAIRRQASAGATIPLWNYRVVSPLDHLTYTGQMVGRSPFYHGFRSTVIQSFLIPVQLTFSDGTVLDPTVSNACLGATTLSVVQNSPLFQTTDWVMNGVDVGTAQYIDGFQRANFWNKVSVAGNSYHNPLALTTLAKISVSVPTVRRRNNFIFVQRRANRHQLVGRARRKYNLALACVERRGAHKCPDLSLRQR
jgi:hypothetical protein